MRCFVIPLVAFGFSLASSLQFRGADFSSLPLLESTTNIQYAASSIAAPQPFEQILYDYGVNLARIRIWTAEPYSLTYGLELARRAKAVGMSLLIDLHYDDSWADPGQQAIPSGWPTDLEGLVSQVYNYTYELVQAFNAQGTHIQFIQVGNEIDDGPLWPIGQITVNGFTGASQLLHAGALAVREASPSTKTVIHLGNGWDQGPITWFYDGLFSVGGKKGLGGGLAPSDVDVMGFSYYAYYGLGATFSNMNSTMHHVVSKYDKEIMIIETDWPAECNTTAMPLSEPTIPVGAKGQITWIENISAILNSVNHVHSGKALGIAWWEPGWIGNAALASGCTDDLLVTGDGVARESMAMFRKM